MTPPACLPAAHGCARAAPVDMNDARAAQALLRFVDAYTRRGEVDAGTLAARHAMRMPTSEVRPSHATPCHVMPCCEPLTGSAHTRRVQRSGAAPAPLSCIYEYEDMATAPEGTFCGMRSCLGQYGVLSTLRSERERMC